MKKLLLIILIFVGLNSFSQSIGKREIKAAYIFNFIKQITWENDSSLTKYEILLFGDSDFYNFFNKTTNNRKVKNKDLIITFTDKLIDFSKYNIILVGKDKSLFLKRIFKNNYHNHLIISETENSNFSVINFIEKENFYKFELNETNLKKSGLKAKSYLSRMTISDVSELRNIINEKETKLKENQKIVKAQKDIIIEQKKYLSEKIKEINQKETDLLNLIKNIDSLKTCIDDKVKNLKTLENNVETKEEELNKSLTELEYSKQQQLKQLQERQQQEIEIKKQKEEIKLKQKDIDKQKNVLLYLNKQVKIQQNKIETQTESIQVRDSQIKGQRFAIFIGLGFILLVSLLAFFIYRNYKLKVKTNIKLEKQKVEIEQQSKEIKDKSDEIQSVLDELLKTQKHLINVEKMAALGGLVAGVAHEINTPIGIGVTAISHLQLKHTEFVTKFEKGAVKKSDFIKFLDNVNESTDITFQNLQRAAALVQSFKQISVDQTSEDKREVYIKDYISNVITNLTHEFKRTNIKINVICDTEFKINTYAGAISQIFTNLLMNAKIHAFDKNEIGVININITKDKKTIQYSISDNGKGIPKKNIEKIFEPFFTTKRNEGGSGLGLSIIHNIITNKLKGKIDVESILGKGTTFLISVPVNI